MSSLQTKKDLSLKKIVKLEEESKDDNIIQNLNSIVEGPTIEDEKLFKMKEKVIKNEVQPVEQSINIPERIEQIEPSHEQKIEQINEPLIKKKKQKRKPLSQKHKEALARGRAKALANRRSKAKARKEKILQDKAVRENITQNKLKDRIDKAYDGNNRQAFSNVKEFFSMMEQYERYKASKNPPKPTNNIINKPVEIAKPKPKPINPYDHYFTQTPRTGKTIFFFHKKL